MIRCTKITETVPPIKLLHSGFNSHWREYPAIYCRERQVCDAQAVWFSHLGPLRTPKAIQPHQGASQFQPQLFPARSIGFWHSLAPNHGDRTEAFGRRGTHHARHGRTPQTPPSAKLLCLSLKTGQVVSGKKWRGFKDFAHELWHTAHVQKPCPRGKKEKWKSFHA
jgi:hypothetical protein